MKLTATFKDQQLEAEIMENGFVHISGFLSVEELAEIYGLYQNKHKIINYQNLFWNSTYDLPTEEGLELSEKLKSIVNPKFQELFDNWLLPVAGFMSKTPIDESESKMHRDYTTFDEEKFEYRNIWVPLIDMTHNNGTLFVVPQSHKIFKDSFPMFAQWPYKNLVTRLEREQVGIYAKAGDLVVYIDKTLHGSYKNLTKEPRPVFHGGIIHPEARTQYHRFIADKNEIEIYEVDYHFFFNKEFENPYLQDKYTLTETRKFNQSVITEDMLNDIYGK